jgi:hypothetical protein
MQGVRRAWVSMARRRGAFEHLRLARGTLCMGSIFVVELERSTPPLPVLLGATILDVFNRIGTLNTRLYCSQLSVVCCVSFVQDKTMVNGMHRTAPFSAAKVRRAEAHAPLSVAAIFTPHSTAGRTCFLIVRGLLCCVFAGQDVGERDAPHCAIQRCQGTSSRSTRPALSCSYFHALFNCRAHLFPHCPWSVVLRFYRTRRW